MFLQAAAPHGEAQKVAETWVEKTKETQNIGVEDSRPVKVGHIDSWRMKVTSGGGFGSVMSYITFIPYGPATFQVTAMSRAADEQKYLGRTLVTARSFRPLTEEEKASIVESALHVTTAGTGESLERLGQRVGNAWEPRATALYNGLFVDHVFKGGERVKTLRVRPYEAPEPDASAERKAAPAAAAGS